MTSSQFGLGVAGGNFLAFSSSALLFDRGRVLGCSGSLFDTLDLQFTSSGIGLTEGLVSGGIILRILSPRLAPTLGRAVIDETFESATLGSIGLAFISGMLTGSGTRLAKGCTSGHMLCGFSRLSPRSIVATLTFFPVAVLTHRLTFGFLPSLFYTPVVTPANALTAWQIAMVYSIPVLVYLFGRLTLPEWVTSYLLGLVFASGLALSGMARPSIVLDFFQFGTASFDPSLLGVALAGLGINLIFFLAIVKPRVKNWIDSDRTISTPAASSQWRLPELTNKRIDGSLLIGSVLFGLGWGLSGLCPGPALVNLGASPMSLTMLTWFAGVALGGALAKTRRSKV